MLHDLLTDNYNRLRPKDAIIRRQRTSQMRSRKRMKASDIHNPRNVEDPPQAIEEVSPQKVDDENLFSEDALSRSKIVPAYPEMTSDRDRSFPELDYVSQESYNLQPNANGQVWFPTIPSRISRGDHTFPWTDQASANHMGSPSALDQSSILANNDPVLPSIAEEPLERAFPSGDIATFGCTSAEDISLHPVYSELPTDDALFLESFIGDDPTNRRNSGQSKPSSPLGVVHEPGTSEAPEWSIVKGALPRSSSKLFTAGTLPYRDSRRSLTPQNLALLQPSGNLGKSGSAGDHDRGSEAERSLLSSLVDKFTKCSTAEKQYIKGVFRSSLASVDSQRVPLSLEPLESDLRPMPCSAGSLWGLELPLLEDLEMPGEFITSNVNIFAHHVACQIEQEDDAGKNCSLHYCQGCCLGSGSALEKVLLSVPFAVMRFKRGMKAGKIWTPQSEHWSDRFGNTALHIAAALGAGVEELTNIMDSGVYVNETNTAGQTFMHVRNSKYASHLSDSLSLRSELLKRSFDFARLDVRGQTFIRFLVDDGVLPTTVVECWLDVTL